MPGGWIDLHSHVLPGIDDGAEDLAESLAMARLAAEDGTAVLAATPHVRVDHPEVIVPELAGLVDAVNEQLAREGVDLKVVGGGEVALLDALERPEEELRLVTLGGGGTLLVETPHGPLPGAFDSLLEAVGRRGFRVLLAHPEHSPDIQRRPERMGELADQGILLQVTAGSFTAARKAPWRRAALLALEQGWAHVVASDGHSATWRRPRIGPGLAAAAAAVGGTERELEWMARDVPGAILAGADPPPRPAREHVSRGLLSRLLGR